jgi:hypothetical protein
MNTVPSSSSDHWAVSNALYALLATRDVGAAYRFRQLYVEPVHQDLASQMANLNAYLRLQLNAIPEDTRATREALQNGLGFEHWLHLVATIVVPELVRMGLPFAQPAGYAVPSLESFAGLLNLPSWQVGLLSTPTI